MSDRRLVGIGVAVLLWVGAACSNPYGTSRTGAGGPSDGGLFPWHMTVAGDGPPLRAEPGGTWAFDFDLDVDLSRHVPEMGRFKRIIVAVYGERRHDERGDFRSSASDMVLSSRFTTTGVPIAGSNMWPSLRMIHGRNGSPFEGLATFELPPDGDVARVHRFHGRIEVVLPPDIPRGWWHPRVTLLADVEGVDVPVFLAMFYRERQAPAPRGFQLVEVGRPDPPRLPLAAFQNPRIWGRAGTLPEELDGKVALAALSSFPVDLVLPPGRYPVGPGVPALSPINAVPEVYTTDSILPNVADPELIARLEVTSCAVEGPDGPAPCLRGPEFEPEDAPESAVWQGDWYGIDLTRTGTYGVRLAAQATDAAGRRYEGGGTYRVHSALPLTFSTSCKPGTSFLVGNAYPPKVIVNPPVRASVEVVVEYWPQSAPARKKVWKTQGECSRFGHFAPAGDRLVFDEPGEYRSVVRATFRDRRGRLWMGAQASTGVIAPVKPDIRLRPAGSGATGGSFHAGRGLFIFNRAPVKTARLPGMPIDPSDTLFVDVQPDAGAIETRFSIDVPDPALARRLLDAGTTRSVVLPRMNQRPGTPWTYLRDVVLAATVNVLEIGLVWTPARDGRLTDLPIGPVSRGALDPLSFPGDESIDAWVSFGAVRPGLSALVGVVQRSAWGSGWQLVPNAFGFQINGGKNGDLPGDIYRVQAGVVLQDHETSTHHYDLYSSTLVIAQGSLPSSAVLPPGARPLLSAGGIDQRIFLATDGFMILEAGEDLDIGGMVFPNVPAEVTWTVTKPSGETKVVGGRADRRGIAGSPVPINADQPGAWDVRARVAYGELSGGIPGSPDGRYWACVVPPGGPTLLKTPLPPVTRIDAEGTARIPLAWPDGLRDVTIRFATVMPGLVIEQGTVRPKGAAWEYGFTPTEAVIRAPNFDFRMFSTGQTMLADTAVIRFCLEGMDGDRKVVDALSVVLRGDVLLNERDL